jgi:hypothetical protein
MNRREAVRWLALRVAGATAAALGVSAAALYGPWARQMDGGDSKRPGGDGTTLPAHGGMVRTEALHAPTVQVFKSRPDLRPPAIIIDVPAGPQSRPGLIVTDAHFGAQQGPIIFDQNGNLVWFVALSPDADPHLRAFNVQVQSYQGKPVLTWFRGEVVDGHGEGHYQLYDDAYQAVAQVHAANGYRGDLHEFVLTDTGTALFTCYGTASANLSQYGGPKDGSYFYGVVQEVDVASGRLLFQWRSDEHVPLAESYEPLKAGEPWDYFHVNSICVDPTDQNLIISGRNAWTFYKVNRTTGAVLWRVGGKESDFKLGPGAHFAFQHDVRRWPDGTFTVFDNEGGPPNEASQSRGLVLTLDEQAMTATMVGQYYHSPPVLTTDQGSVQDLGDDYRFVGWGDSSYFTEFDPSGRAIFDGRLAPGTQSYRAFKQAWQGTPARPPDMAVEPADHGLTVYASWNGATGVVTWRVLGGSTPDNLRAMASAPSTGFETTLTTSGSAAYVMVEALDGANRVLARSDARRVSE